MQKIRADERARLDVFLSKKLAQSRNQVAQLIKTGCVLVNDKIQKKSSFLVQNADILTIKKIQVKPCEKEMNLNFDIEVLFEDEDILVLNKPPKLVVHSAKSVKEQTLIDWLKYKNYTLSSLNGELRAGLVHRLDKDTSGAILIAKNNFTHRILSEQLKDKSIERLYLALIDLPLKQDFIIVEKALARSPQNRLKKLALKENQNLSGAKSAKSAFVHLLSSDKDQTSLIAAKLFTGRTHQIRAHLESLNRHILGDVLYGYGGVKYERVMLHSYFLNFMHPKKAKKLCIKAPLYDDFNTIMQKKFQKGAFDEKNSFDFIHSCFVF